MHSKKPAETAQLSRTLMRASISFPADLHQTLEAIAKQKKVSFAWVVRDAAERYIAGRVERDASRPA